MASTRPPEEAAPPDATLRSTTRGFFLITGAKAWFFLSAGILNFGLPKLISQAEYGAYGVIVNAVSWLNMVVIAGTLQTVAKLVSEAPGQARAVMRQAALVQVFIGGSLVLGYLALAGPLADALRDPTYAPLLRVSAIIAACYSFYAIFIGYLNGSARFAQQAGLDILFATLRTTCILAAVALGWGVAGAIGGFAMASALILLSSALWVRRILSRAPPPQDDAASPAASPSALRRRLIRYLIVTMVYAFAFNALTRFDLFWLKRVSVDALAVFGAQAAEASNALTGCYNLMLNVARLPYQAVIALTFVIFPLISRSTFEQDADATRAYLRATMRAAMLMVAGLVAVFAGAGADLLRPVYPQYMYGAEILPLLCIAYGAFALLYVATTAMVAAGLPGVATGVTTVTLLLLAVGCWALLGPGQDALSLLSTTSWIVAATMALGLITSAATLLRRYDAFIAPASFARIAVAAGVVIALGALTRFDLFVDFALPGPLAEALALNTPTPRWPGGRLVWFALGVAKAGALLLFYALALLVSGEVKLAQARAAARRLLRRRA